MPTFESAVRAAWLTQVLIRKHEGFSKFPKPDAHDTIQIGYGTNLSRRGITVEEARMLMVDEIDQGEAFLRGEPWWSALAPARQAVLLDMAYALGIAGLFGFHKFIAALAAESYDVAADEILASAFAHEDVVRATEDAAIMRSGQYRDETCNLES